MGSRETFLLRVPLMPRPLPAYCRENFDSCAPAPDPDCPVALSGHGSCSTPSAGRAASSGGAVGSTATPNGASNWRQSLTELGHLSRSRGSSRPSAITGVSPRSTQTRERSFPASLTPGSTAADNGIFQRRIAELGADVSSSRGPMWEDEGPSCFKLRKIKVQELLQDGSLGLILHGTSLVGFSCAEAAEAGWSIGDQIVEVNGHRVANFEEFLDRFLGARTEGLPIEFFIVRKEHLANVSVVREEKPDGTFAEVDGTLTDFLSRSDLWDIAGRMHQKFGTTTKRPSEEFAFSIAGSFPDDGSDHMIKCESITENPYIQALRKRRTELIETSETWEHLDKSLPSQLATKRSDALSTLLSNSSSRHPQNQRVDCGALSASMDITIADCGSDDAGGGLKMHEPFMGLPKWSLHLTCGSAPGCGAVEASSLDIQPTPRVDLESSDLDPRQFMPASAFSDR